MNTDKHAALALLERAYRADTQGTLYLLLRSAKQLDSTLDTESIAKLWIEMWMTRRAVELKASLT